MKETLFARDVMKKGFYCINKNTPIRAALASLTQMQESLIFVVDNKKKFCGVFSENSAIKPFTDAIYFDCDPGVVGDFMDTDTEFVSPGDSPHQIVQKFMKTPYQVLPVMDDGAIVGRISLQAFLKAMYKEKCKKERFYRLRNSSLVKASARYLKQGLRASDSFVKV